MGEAGLPPAGGTPRPLHIPKPAFCSFYIRAVWDEGKQSVICAIQHGSQQTWVSTEYFKCGWCKGRSELEILLIIFFDSFMWLSWVLVVTCGIQFPHQGSNLGPLHWECGVLATGPPGKSLNFT